MSNWTTPDPGIIERPYVQQIPLEALFKNLSYKQSRYDQGYQQAKQALSLINNIPSFGHDTEVKNQLYDKLNESLKSFDGANFADQAVNSQLDGLINSFTSSKEITGIQARAMQYNKMAQEEEAARLKGQEYYNPGLDEAKQYFTNGVYKKDARFNDSGNLAPDLEKIRDGILKLPNVQYKETTVSPDGFIKTIDRVDGKRAAEEYANLINTDPKLSKYMAYKFGSAYGQDTDWKKEGINHYSGMAEQAQSLADQNRVLASLNRKDPAKARYFTELASQYENESEKYRTITSDPALVGADYKSRLFDEFKVKEATKFGTSKELSAVSKLDESKFALEAQKNAQEIKMARINDAFDRGVDPETGQDLHFNPDIPALNKTGHVTIDGTQYEPDHVAKSVEDFYAGRDKDGEFIKDIAAKKVGLPAIALTIEIGTDGKAHIYPKDQTTGKKALDSDGKAKPELGVFSKDNLYASLPSNIQKQVNTYKQGILKSAKTKQELRDRYTSYFGPITKEAENLIDAAAKARKLPDK